MVEAAMFQLKLAMVPLNMNMRRQIYVGCQYSKCKLFTRGSSVILKTFLLGHHEVATLILRHLHFPPPGSGGSPRVDVYVDLVTLIRGWHPHVLARVVAADDGRAGPAGVGDRESVRGTVPNT